MHRNAPSRRLRCRRRPACRAGSLIYLNNRIEADHGPIKRLCRATLGFKSMKTAYATIKGFEVMRMIRKRQCILLESGVTGEVRFVNKLFALAA
jgi:IS6 family transposase